MGNTIIKIIRKMELVERVAASVIFCSMMIVVTAQILMRYVFNHPLLWSEEFARYVYVWLVFIGSAYGVTQEKHVAVTILTDRLPEPVRNALKLVCNLLVIAALLYMLPHSVKYLGRQHGLRSGCMQLPMSLVFAAVPVGYLLMVIHMALQSALLVFRDRRREEQV